jgi:hypothetical protein
MYACGGRGSDGLIACSVFANPSWHERAVSEALGDFGEVGPRLSVGAPGAAGLFFEPHRMALAAPLRTGAATFAFTAISNAVFNDE